MWLISTTQNANSCGDDSGESKHHSVVSYYFCKQPLSIKKRFINKHATSFLLVMLLVPFMLVASASVRRLVQSISKSGRQLVFCFSCFIRYLLGGICSIQLMSSSKSHLLLLSGLAVCFVPHGRDAPLERCYEIKH